MISKLPKICKTWVGCFTGKKFKNIIYIAKMIVKFWVSDFWWILESLLVSLDSGIVFCTLLVYLRGPLMPIGITELVKSFITCGTPSWEFFKWLFGKPFTCIAVPQSEFLTCPMKKHFHRNGEQQCLFLQPFGFQSSGNFISTLLIGNNQRRVKRFWINQELISGLSISKQCTSTFIPCTTVTLTLNLLLD